MTAAVKVLGLIMLFISCAAAGFSKTARLTARKKRLEKIIAGLRMLDCRLRYEGTERQRLLTDAFGGDTVVFDGAAPQLRAPELSAEDFQPLYEFFFDFGSGDTETEHKRIRICCELLGSRLKTAEKDCAQLGRVYCVLGMCAGGICCLLMI